MVEDGLIGCSISSDSISLIDFIHRKPGYAFYTIVARHGFLYIQPLFFLVCCRWDRSVRVDEL